MIGLLTRPSMVSAPDCSARACDEKCLVPARQTASGTRQALRWAACGLAMASGGVLIGMAGACPGHRRLGRAGWAVGHVATWVLRALGVRVQVSGAPAAGPGLLVGNHVSFLDLLVLAATSDNHAGPMAMVSKVEVGQWPLVGWISRRVGSIFLDRRNIRALPGTVREIADAIRSGRRVQVFPEGTTRCGRSTGTFSRAAFQAAIDTARCVSPFSLRYLVAGQSSTAPAFLGQESIFDCLRRVIACPELQVELRWSPPFPAIPRTGRRAVDRKNLALRAEHAVAGGLAGAVGVSADRARAFAVVGS